MDDRSTEDTCLSCGKSTTLNVSYPPGELIITCSKCGQVIKYERTDSNG